jgi:hypothetical protein
MQLSELNRFQHAHLVFRLARVTDVDAYVAIEVANCMLGDMALASVFTFFGVSAEDSLIYAEKVERCQSD